MNNGSHEQDPVYLNDEFITQINHIQGLTHIGQLDAVDELYKIRQNRTPTTANLSRTFWNYVVEAQARHASELETAMTPNNKTNLTQAIAAELDRLTSLEAVVNVLSNQIEDWREEFDIDNLRSELTKMDTVSSEKCMDMIDAYVSANNDGFITEDDIVDRMADAIDSRIEANDEGFITMDALYGEDYASASDVQDLQEEVGHLRDDVNALARTLADYMYQPSLLTRIYRRLRDIHWYSPWIGPRR